MYDTYDKEKAAAEYLVAFIKHLYRKGKNSFEISKTLQIDIDLIDKLLKNDKLLPELKTRNVDFVKKLQEKYTDPEVLKQKCNELGINFFVSKHNNDYYFYGHSGYLKNIGPWQRQNNFTDALSYYFGTKKRKYTNSDMDVLAKLSTGVLITEEEEKLTDRTLTPAYRMRIINDITDGCKEQEISEKFNCSIPAVKQIADDYELQLPVTEKSIVSRIVKAIKQGYSFDHIARRFYNYNTYLIEDLIKTYRILPASEGKIDTDIPS